MVAQERQYGKQLSEIRSDHVERYNYASELVGGYVLDAGCGCGYGSYTLCMKNSGVKVLGVDKSPEALDFARMNWKHERNSFSQWDLDAVAPGLEFNWLVAFEVIEHLKNPEQFLKSAAKVCKNFIVSVPNESVMRYDPKRYIFHYRHYTDLELMRMLEDCGFAVKKVQYQASGYAEGLNNISGRTIIMEGVSLVA